MNKRTFLVYATYIYGMEGWRRSKFDLKKIEIFNSFTMTKEKKESSLNPEFLYSRNC